MKVRLVLLLAGWLSVAMAADLPPLTLPAGVGVNIHFNRGHTADLDRIAAAGFKFVRMDLGWEGIERTRGQYDWSADDELVGNLERRGLRAILILDYSNPLYEGTVTTRNAVFGGEQKDTASPQHPESVAAFARWAAAAATHFKTKRIVWEIWNEPNIFFWKPKPDVAQYTALALATCRAVRAADPHATLIGPATSEVPLKFLEDFFAAGGLAQLDAVSVHPYRDYRKPPETAADDYAKLRALIQRYAPAGRKNLPIISGEWGYSTRTKGVSLEIQAAFIARQQLANLYAGVPISIWYDWKNDGNDPAEGEHNFGTVLPDLTPKPAYTAVKTLTTELGGFHLVQRLSVGTDADFVLRFADAHGQQKLAVWTAGAAHEVSVEARVQRRARLQAVTGQGERFGLDLATAGGGAALTASAGGGEQARIRYEPGRLVISAGAAPLYVALNGVRLAAGPPR
jgi:hypothetical protein